MLELSRLLLRPEPESPEDVRLLLMDGRFRRR